MDSDGNFKIHPSIRKGFSLPPPIKCNSCCSPSKFHCPFCSPTFFKPTKPCRVKFHLTIHLKKAFYIGDYTIHRCGLECRPQPHFHCLYCTATLIRKRDFTNHLPFCRQAKERRAKKLSKLQAGTTERVRADGLRPAEMDTTASNTQSNEDNDIKTIIPDSQDQISQAADSSQSLILFSPNSKECDIVRKMKRSTKLEASKCDQSVQTVIDKPQDCDEYYFMSLVTMFKKLSPQKKADVRMKIERVLLEAEFE
ncbi:uncharacterized protein [Brachyistius frenatus]|uniref:uncharacterized protein n=1 Tax=Brachyistius frenatus TaxID=100188 RepID=UPI0037E8990E